jgi:hypothetical protein
MKKSLLAVSPDACSGAGTIIVPPLRNGEERNLFNSRFGATRPQNKVGQVLQLVGEMALSQAGFKRLRKKGGN